jgi:uncharacterized cupredoxin-like copper-binding protein
VVAAGLATALVMSGCGGHGAVSAGNRPIVDVTERDFAIVAPASVHAGEVTLRVHNEGPVGHELIVVRSTSARLPLRSDGLTVDEDDLERSQIGVLEPHDAPATRDLAVTLTPGRYVLFCNMSGHFFGGMHHVLIVR